MSFLSLFLFSVNFRYRSTGFNQPVVFCSDFDAKLLHFCYKEVLRSYLRVGKFKSG